MSRFIPCDRCGRHVRARDLVCPFCAAKVACGVIATTLAVACHDSTKGAAVEAGPEPAVSAAVAPSASAPADASAAVAIVDAGSDAGGLSGLSGISPSNLDWRGPGAVYGGPPPERVDGGSAPTGDVAVGAATSSKTIDGADRVIAGARGRFRACYNAGLKQDPTQSGKLTLSVVVAPNGNVETASVASNSGLSPAVASCVAGVARNLQLAADDARGGNVTLTIPLTFTLKSK